MFIKAAHFFLLWVQPEFKQTGYGKIGWYLANCTSTIDDGLIPGVTYLNGIQSLGESSPENDCWQWLTFRQPITLLFPLPITTQTRASLHSFEFPESFDSENDIHSGCPNVSHYQQSFSVLPSPRRSNSIEACTSIFKIIIINKNSSKDLPVGVPQHYQDFYVTAKGLRRRRILSKVFEWGITIQYNNFSLYSNWR